MPQVTLDITPTTDRLPNYAGRLCESAYLFALSAVLTGGSAKTGRCHVQIGIYSVVANEASMICCLVDDYVYDGHIPSWSGRVPIEESQGVIAIVRSADAVTVRVVGSALKKDP